MLIAVFDPSLVIGEAYRSVNVLTDTGQVVQGLLIEKSDQRIVLKVQGGKQQIIPIGEVEEIKQNQKSLMPEGIEQQLSKQELADLFALLCLEASVDSGEKSVIPGTPGGLRPSDQ
jgi:putative heme-binding domain-containing protein